MTNTPTDNQDNSSAIEIMFCGIDGNQNPYHVYYWAGSTTNPPPIGIPCWCGLTTYEENQ